MKQKLLILLSLLILLVPLIHSFKAYANPLALVVKPAAKRAIIPLMEKTGAQLANKTARQKARAKWTADLQRDYELYGGQDPSHFKRYQDLADELAQTPVPIPEKPGVGKILLSTTAFLTGADIFVDGYLAYKNAYDNQIPTNFYPGNQTGSETFENGFSYKIQATGANYSFLLLNPNGTLSSAYRTDFKEVFSYQEFFVSYNGGLSILNASLDLWANPAKGDLWYKLRGKVVSSDMSYQSKQAIPTADVVVAPLMPPQLAPLLFGVPAIPAELPDFIEIEVPLDDTNIDSATYNQPLTETDLTVPKQPKYIPNPDFNPNLDPSPANPKYKPNPKYNPDRPLENDPTQDPTFDPVRGNPSTKPTIEPKPKYLPNPFFDPFAEPSPELNPRYKPNPEYDPFNRIVGDPTADPLFDPVGGEKLPPDIKPPKPDDLLKFKPWLLLLAFLDLLRAIVFYLLRLIEYVLTLPLIPIKEIPVYKEGFIFFRDLSISGINVYKIVMMMLNFALGFVVYKVIQKVFNSSGG